MHDKTIQDRHTSKLIARFKQVLAVTICVQLMTVLSAVFLKFTNDTVIIIGLDLLLMCLLYFLANKERIELAKQIYLWVNLILVGYLFWKNGGLMSSGLVLVFPVFLMISALISSRATFFSVFAYIVILISAIGVATINGWNTVVATEFSYWHLITTLVMLWAAAYTAWRFSGDMKHALKKLKSEVENVNKSRDKIERLIHNDPLTGLSSRLDCKQKFSLLTKQNNQSENRISFLFIDIDNFKAINDYYNHSFGDELLKKIASQLQGLITADDIACRLSGDEFLLVITRPKNYSVELFAELILKNLSQSIEINEYMVEVTISIGATSVEAKTDDFESIVKRADLAMYHSKQSGKNQYAFYDNEILKQSRRKVDIINGLKAALKNNDLELFIQPQVNLDTGKIQSGEALLRWVRNNPENISPAEFIPLIESTELICSIGEWVISNACRLCKEIQNNGFDNFTVAINISAAQFAQGGLEQIIIEELQKSDLSPECLELELTEHTLFQDDEAVVDELSRIKDLGLALSIDDFGTGYSNLGYLTKLNVDFLKIDRSFITGINKLSDNFVIVDAIIKMAKTLGLKVVAEGVETEQEWTTLKKLKCDFGQGYVWSKPIALDDFLKLPSEIS